MNNETNTRIPIPQRLDATAAWNTWHTAAGRESTSTAHEDTLETQPLHAADLIGELR